MKAFPSITLAAVGLALAGCAHDEKVSPVGAASGMPTGTTTATTPPTEEPPPPPTPKRTLVTRDPFGNVDATNNLMWDGDFEWSSAFADQYAWFTTRGQLVDDFALGVDCVSGIKCARIAKNAQVVGLAVGSTSALRASIYVRITEGGAGCDTVDVALFSQGIQGSDPDVALVAGEDPTRPGWCKFAGNSPPRSDQTYLYVDNGAGAPIVLDDAVLERIDDGDAIALTPVLVAPPQLVARIDDARAAAKAARLPQDGRKERERARFGSWLDNQSKGTKPR